MMDEHAVDHNVVQPGWKISDEPVTPTGTDDADAAAETDETSVATDSQA